MEYILVNNYHKLGIDKPFDLAKDTICQEENNIIRHGNDRICYVTSADAYDYFARNNDGKGKQRHQLSHEIMGLVAQAKKDYCDAVNEVLEGFERDEQGNYPEEAAAAVDAVENKAEEFFAAMRADEVFANFLSNGYWNRNFFEADVNELKRLKAIIA